MLWYDEAYTAWLAGMPLVDMVRTTLADVHPPTWYAIEMVFVRVLGMSEWALRLPSAILGTLAVWLTYRLARNVDDGILPYVAAGLMAVNPLQVYYSQEARMYALLTVGVLLATLGIVERRNWMTALGTSIMLMSHNLTVIYVPALFAVSVYRNLFRTENYGWMQRIALDAWPFALGAVPWLAWIPNAITQATTGGSLTIGQCGRAESELLSHFH
jgi:uncharacterized membrane protein